MGSSSPLGDSRGDFTLNGAFMLIFLAMLLVLFISVLGAVNTNMKLHSVAAEAVRYIEVRGKVDAPVYTEIDRLANVAGVNIERCSIDATYSGGNKLQFGAPFSVTLQTTVHFGIGGVLSASVPLRSTVSGRSEQYWK